MQTYAGIFTDFVQLFYPMTTLNTITIKPDAKPSSAFCRRSGMSRFIKNTNDAPSMVPNRGMSKPIKSVVIS